MTKSRRWVSRLSPRLSVRRALARTLNHSPSHVEQFLQIGQRLSILEEIITGALRQIATMEQEQAYLVQQLKDLEHAHHRAESAHQLAVDQLFLMELMHALGSCRYVGHVGRTLLFAARNKEVRALITTKAKVVDLQLGTASPKQIAQSIVRGEVGSFSVGELLEDTALIEWSDRSEFLTDVGKRDFIVEAFSRLEDLTPKAGDISTVFAEDQAYAQRMATLQRLPDLIDFVALGVHSKEVPVPFNNSQALPSFSVYPEPKKRSVLFVHNSYYHFNILSEALRKRGWSATTVSIANPADKQQQFFHGEDVNLFDPDPSIMQHRIAGFFKHVPEQFGAVHFYGMGYGTLFPENVEAGKVNRKVPWDFLELRRHQLVIGNMPSGCMEGARPSSIAAISENICSRCVWQLRPDVCSEQRSEAWIEKLNSLCDWIGLEGDWQTRERQSPRHVALPVATALSAESWRPDLPVPDEFKIKRKPGEMLIYHAVGNYEARRDNDRDIKGTGAVLSAIERLRAEGCSVRLFFATSVPSRSVRYYQVQADIVVDQLVYGRLGANARESMMLGRPLVTSLRTAAGEAAPWISECPAEPASEETVYGVLRSLIHDPARLESIGKASRAYAMRWYASQVCAERFEKIVDGVREGTAPSLIDKNLLGRTIRQVSGARPFTSGG